MRRSLLAVLGLAAALSGCHHPKYDLTAKYPEEYVVPPDESRFNNPPESSYRKPADKKEFAPGPGGGNSPGMGGPGMGGQGMGGMGGPSGGQGMYSR